MKIVVIGYGKLFANLILGSIKSGNSVVGVFLHERVRLNSFKLFFKNLFNQSKDKSFIKSLNLHEIKAPSINSEKFKKEILKLSPDIIFIGSWSEKINPDIIKLPSLAMINCHPSLLPKYRGPNPYTQVIIHNEKQTGITFHLVNETFDSGNILHQRKVEISETETGFSLQNKCAVIAFEEVQILLNKLNEEIIIPIKQNEKIASYYSQLELNQLFLDFSKTSDEIDAFIRGVFNWCKPFVSYKGLYFSFSSHEIIENKTQYNEPFTIVDKSKNSISILCADNKVIKLQNPKFLDAFCNNLYLRFLVKVGEQVSP